MTYNLLHNKLKIDQRDFHKGSEVPVPLVAPVVLLL
jgi:hypothetical protein